MISSQLHRSGSIGGVMEKRCVKCHRIKPGARFYKRRGSKDGRDAECMVCKRASRKAYAKREALANKTRRSMLIRDDYWKAIKVVAYDNVERTGATIERAIAEFLHREFMARGFAGGVHDWLVKTTKEEVARASLGRAEVLARSLQGSEEAEVEHNNDEPSDDPPGAVAGENETKEGRKFPKSTS